MRTTIELDDDLFRQAKIQAAQEGTTLKELFERSLRLVVGKPPTPASGQDLTTPIFPAKSTRTVKIASDILNRINALEDQARHDASLRR